MAKSCKNCGEVINDDSLFCPKCGKYIKRSRVEKSTPVKWILIAVAVVLLVIAGGIFFMPDDSKTDTSIQMVSNSNLDTSNTYSVQLRDAANNTLAGKFISVDYNGNNYTLKTDENGIASINLTASDGSYEINSYFGGDDDYLESHTSDIVVK